MLKSDQPASPSQSPTPGTAAAASWTAGASDLRARLLLVVAIALVPVLAMLVHSALEQRRAADDAARADARLLAQVLARRHLDLIEETRQLLAVLARVLDSLGGDPARCHELLAGVREREHVHANLAVADADGRLWCSALPIPEPVDASQRLWFRRAAATGTFALGGFQVGYVTGIPTLNLALPVLHADGSLRAVLMAALDLRWLNRLTATVDTPPGTTLVLFDSDGTVLARHPDPDAWVGRTAIEAKIVQAVLAGTSSLTLKTEGLDGVSRIHGAIALGTPAWEGYLYVAAGIPARAARAEADRQLVRNAAGFAVAVGLALGSAWVGAEVLLLRRIRGLADATHRLAAGDLGSRVGGAAGKDELAALSRAFNVMAAALQEGAARRLAAEEDLNRLNLDLERRVEERTSELAAANRELEAFSYSVSHDLRAPLRAIDGFAQALLEDCAERLDATGRRHLDRVRAGAQRMGELIDSLLQLARVTQQPLRRQAADVGAEAARLLADLAAREPERRVDVVVHGAPNAKADPDLLRVLLQNLVENAWKFTSRSDPSRIEIGAEVEADETRYFVRDDGAGFDKEHASRLFVAFQRLHRASTFPGTGVGLATVQRVAHRHGGRAWAEGRPGEGATFWFTLRADSSDE